MKKSNDTKDYSEQLEFLNSQPYYANKKCLSSRQIFRYAVPARTVTKSTAYQKFTTHIFACHPVDNTLSVALFAFLWLNVRDLIPNNLCFVNIIVLHAMRYRTLRFIFHKNWNQALKNYYHYYYKVLVTVRWRNHVLTCAVINISEEHLLLV